jgi:hypothetical protein
MKNEMGKIIIAPGLNIWPHELKTAKTLAAAGFTVEFIRRSEEPRRTSADVKINGAEWEIKSPESDNLKAVQRNLHRALKQSNNVIFDCRRMKRLPSEVIEREVRTQAKALRSLKRLIFISKKGKVVDIK